MDQPTEIVGIQMWGPIRYLVSDCLANGVVAEHTLEII